MTVLVVAEHDNGSVKPATLNAVAAASELSKAGAGDIHILVAGEGCRGAADAAAKIGGVAKVLIADDAAYGHGLARMSRRCSSRSRRSIRICWRRRRPRQEFDGRALRRSSM